MAHDDQKHGGLASQEAETPMSGLAVKVLDVLLARQTKVERRTMSPVENQLYQEIVSPIAFDAFKAVAELRVLGVSDDDVVDHYIPRCATRIGVAWEVDEMSFAQVTIASMRLQSLLSELSFAPDGTAQSDFSNVSAMIAILDNDQHTLGAFTAAAHLRRMGLEVGVVYAETPEEVIDSVLKSSPDILLFSCSRPRGIEPVKTVIEACQTKCNPMPFTALGGLVLEHGMQDLGELNVDTVTSSLTDMVAAFRRSRGSQPEKGMQ